MAKRPQNNGSAWSPADLRTLRKLASQRLSSREAAAQMGRTPAAIQQKAMREGIAFRALRRGRAASKKK